MTRRRVKSAFWLTLKIFKYLTILNWCSNIASNTNNNNFNVQASTAVQASIPKFGDRLSPRRTFNSDLDNKYQKDNNNNAAAASAGFFLHSSNLNNNQYNNHAQKNIEHAQAIQNSDEILDESTEHEYSNYQLEDEENENLFNKNNHKNDINRSDKISLKAHDNKLNNNNNNDSNSVTQSLENKEINKNLDYFTITPEDLNNNLIKSDNQIKLNASDAQAHRLEMSTEFFVVPSTKASAISQVPRSTTVRPGGVIFATKTTTATPPTVILANLGGLRKEPWVVPILIFSCISMILMAGFEVFVLFKAWRSTPSRRHLFLGQMLLLGLFACSGLAAVLTANPTPLTCGAIRFGAGFAFTLVFASLLVKCVFLISLNGGVYLPAPYQALLLLFAVLIQIAIGTQWLITTPPSIDNVVVPATGTAISSRYHLLLTSGDLSSLNPTIPLCHTQFSDLLLSLVYVVFLIVFVSILAIKSRGIRDNYREATYIGLAIAGAIPIWLGWTLCGLAVADRHRDACLAFGLVATSSTVFLVMFMPKGRQLAAMGKEGLYVEDREERFSSLSRTGSGYSPSFFHFKPIKYGVMGQSQSPTPNTNTVNNYSSTKHQAVATLGGDFDFTCK
uniref:CSON012890 protein n=1 Tax=Culicoides sonorensis TaxID=179676 RepID=A0A336MIP6_CULSO